MADRLVGVTDTTPGVAVTEVLTQERPSFTVATTNTADPGAAGTTLAVTSAALFPATNNYKIRVENEVMLVTGGAGTTSWTVTRGQDGTTAVAHATGRTVAQIAAAQYVIPISNRSVSFVGALCAFRTLGNAATPHNLLTIENAAGSGVLVGVTKMTVDMDATAALLSVTSQFIVHRTTAVPSGGTVLTKQSLDTALTSSSSVVIRGATASAGGAATAITATAAAGSGMWCQSLMRMATQAGQMLPLDADVLPGGIVENDWLVLRAGQAIVLQVVGTAASNAATNHYMPKLAWFEFSVP